MPIEVSVNRELAIQLVRFSGRVTSWEAAELCRLHAMRPELLELDSVQILDENADLSELTPPLLDQLRAVYNDLLRNTVLVLVRRSGWVCSSASACSAVEYWLDGRHSRDGQGTEVCLVAQTRDLDMLFTPEEIESVVAARGFVEVMRIEENHPVRVT